MAAPSVRSLLFAVVAVCLLASCCAQFNLNFGGVPGYGGFGYGYPQNYGYQQGYPGYQNYPYNNGYNGYNGYNNGYYGK